MFFALMRNSLADAVAHFGDIFPRDGSFEGLGDEVIFKAEVSEIANHESQEISSFTILSSSLKSFLLFS
jgi:hypothetical protein